MTTSTPEPTSPLDTAADVPRRTTPRHQSSELALILVFLVIIFGVPICQIALELFRREHVQYTDLFRYAPTERNLRDFEANLEEKSIFQQAVRPRFRQLMFEALRDPGSKAVVGEDGWIFYRPDVRYLIEPDRPQVDGTSKWIDPRTPQLTSRQTVVRAIVRFRDELRQRSVDLLVMPIPGKPSLYPDKLSSSASIGQINSPTLELMRELNQAGVLTIDLFTVFGDFRRTRSDPLYLARDTHWTPNGAALAAQQCASRIQSLKLTGLPQRTYTTELVAVQRFGDVLDMMQVPGLSARFEPETFFCTRLIDSASGPLVPRPADRPGTFRHTSPPSGILVMGDSFCRIYQLPEPQSLGSVPTYSAAQQPAGKRLLPGSAGFISFLAGELKTPVDFIVSDGGASIDVRLRLSTYPQILAGKKLVIWEFVERDIALGASGWRDVPLPPRLE